MDEDESRGLLKSVLAFFARNQGQTSGSSAPLRSQARDAWPRTDSFLQHENDEINEIGVDQVARTLNAFENLIQDDSHPNADLVSIIND